MDPRQQTISKAFDALRAGDAALATRLCRRLLRKRAGDVEALKLLAHALLLSGTPEHAVQEAGKAVRIAPGDLEAWLVLGRAQIQCGRADAACQSLEQAVQCDARNAAAWHELAFARRLAANVPAALEAFARAFEIAPTTGIYRDNYVLALIENGCPEQAREICEAASAREPDNPELLHLHGQALLASGELHDARVVLQRAHALAPGNVAITSTLGTCLAAANEHEKALPLLRLAARSGTPPEPLHKALIHALAESGRAQEAFERLQRRHADDPDALVEKLVDTLGSLLENHLLAQASSLIEVASAMLPGNARLLGEAARLATFRYRYDEARKLLEEALASLPTQPGLRRYLESLEYRTGHLDRALALTRERFAARTEAPRAPVDLLHELNCLDHAAPGLVSEVHAIWAQAVEARVPDRNRSFVNAPDPSRRLRVGYLSPDFRTHSVAYFLEPLLASHDRAACEILCYANRGIVDDTTRRLRGLADRWRRIDRLSDDELLAVILDDQVDILVDLAGHTQNNRLSLFAMRAAPVQVAWLGYPNTTGLSTMDYRLCDAICDPPGDQDQLYSESLFRLPHGFLCYQAPDVAPLPRDPHRDGICFGSFNNLAKLSDTTLALWCRILAKAPESRLLLKARQLADPLARATLVERLARHGIDQSRVELHGRIDDKRHHLQHYSRIDIALDTTPYNGTTTTCEALWMGVPTIVLRGDRHASRVGASILSHAGQAELIAEDADDFVARAVALAGDRERLRAYHRELRARVADSALCDAEGFARQVETAYRAMWRRHLEQRTQGDRT